MTKQYISWEEFHKKTLLLVEELKKKEQNFEGVVAVTRGGLVPTAIVTQYLGLQAIETFCIRSYHREGEQSTSSILKTVSSTQSRWLVIDELVDSGHTARLIKARLPHCYIASIYAKPKGIDAVDCYVEEVPQDTWLVFPWEP